MFRPKGPNNIPAKINPMIWGILILFNKGADKIIINTNKKIGIGSVSGKCGSVNQVVIGAILFYKDRDFFNYVFVFKLKTATWYVAVF